MLIQEGYEQSFEQEFDAFVHKFKEVLTAVLNGEMDVSSTDFKESIDELVIIGSTFGLQYGVNHKFRRCDSKYLQRTENNVNIINLHYTFSNLIHGLLLIQKSIVECKKVFICGPISIDMSLTSILHSIKWIPGTLTNSQFVLPKYPFSKQLNISKGSVVKNSVPVSVIFSLMPRAYDVISREVLAILNREIIFDVSRGKRKGTQIQYIGLMDTNINSIEHTNITNICINGHSRYTKKLLASLLSSMFTNLAKKQN